MSSPAFLFVLAFFAGIIWISIRITIWIIKTAIKEALREYDEEKRRGLHIYGSKQH
jgi:hypothetical protein